MTRAVEIEGFTEDEVIEFALISVARNNGNSHAAHRELKASGVKVAQKTLWNWSRRLHADRYRDVRAQVLPAIRAHAADRHMDMAEKLNKANEKIVARLTKNVDEIPARDLPGAARNISTAIAVETDKAQLLNDQPTERRAIDLPGVLNELKALGVDAKHVLNLEATEEPVTDTEAIEEAQTSD